MLYRTLMIICSHVTVGARRERSMFGGVRPVKCLGSGAMAPDANENPVKMLVRQGKFKTRATRPKNVGREVPEI